jgi:hypothetical protein
MTPRLAMRCRHCHCTDLEPCRLANGDSCQWFNRDCSVCSSPGCIKAETARLAAMIPKPERKTTPAEIHALIRKGRRSGLARRIRRSA